MMENVNVKKVLGYYLEYEIYNIVNSSKIKINNRTSMVVSDLLNYKCVSDDVHKLKEFKIRDRFEKFVGKRVADKKVLLQSVYNELLALDDELSNKVQVVFRVASLFKEYIRDQKFEKSIDNFANELCDIIATQEFWLYAYNVSFINKNWVNKLPLFIFKCKLDGDVLDVLEVNVNLETLYTILAVILDKEISDVMLEYEDRLLNYNNEIKSIIDGGDIYHLLDLYFFKLKEFVGISIDDVVSISDKNCKFNVNKEFVISIDAISEDGVKNIKEDIELLVKLIDNNDYVPVVLEKYLYGSVGKNNINDFKYGKPYRGNYKSSYGVGCNQFKIVNCIDNNDLIAVEGPPGTGKTSLLKEIIANKVVERANLILQNWDKGLEECKYYGTTYYDFDWFNNSGDTIKSIVVSSKNSEAIDNVGKEINKEIAYMQSVAEEYRRTEKVNGEVQRNLQGYKGIVCLPLGKKDNVQDFKKFLYDEYIPMLKSSFLNEDLEKEMGEVKESYESKCAEVSFYEQLVNLFNYIKDRSVYFYGVELSRKKEDKDDDELKIKQIQKLFKDDKQKKQEELDELRISKDNLMKQMVSQEDKLKFVENSINKIEVDIKNSTQIISDGASYVRSLKIQMDLFDKFNKNIFNKFLNYRDYKNFKNIDFFGEISKIEVSNKVEEEKILQYIKDKSVLERQKDDIEDKFDKLNQIYSNLQDSYGVLEKQIDEMELIEEFNRKNKDLYWNYDSVIEMCGKSSLNDLNQELFELALKLNEMYIIKNCNEIVNNLKLFLPDGDDIYICQKFYDSSDIYSVEKQEGIRCLWNTLFLCFPVVTTTLDSFAKRYFHLIPEYIDLLLIDEAGQILPHNLVSALYRSKKAVIVGDVNQIEPIYNKLNRDFSKHKMSIGEMFDDIKIEENSVQMLANKNTDILSNNDNIILNDHYRCEKNIVDFSNKNVYKNVLNMHIEDKMDKVFSNNMIALDVRGKKHPDENFNKVEVESCIEVVKYIKEHSKDDISIAIITPFKKQKEEIKHRLEAEGMQNVKVGTVHSFQGQEKDFIIFSPVIDSIESKWTVNFIGKRCNMLNVAVTRAKRQFIYLGNLSVALQTDNYISKLVSYIANNGLVYSLYDIDGVDICECLDERVLKILQPELKLDNDNIGLYIKQNVKNGVITDAKNHYDLLRYVLKNAKEEVYIMAPWLRGNVINDEFIEDIIALKKKNCKIKIVFGYKNGNSNISSPNELVLELQRTNSLGFAKQEEVMSIIEKMYQVIGKENFVYDPPTHAKVLIVDNKYMCIGSHNWLSNAGKTNEKDRALEGTIVTTSVFSIGYAKEEFFGDVFCLSDNKM